jgi:hypothetical protein
VIKIEFFGRLLFAQLVALKYDKPPSVKIGNLAKTLACQQKEKVKKNIKIIIRNFGSDS